MTRRNTGTATSIKKYIFSTFQKNQILVSQGQGNEEHEDPQITMTKHRITKSPGQPPLDSQ